MPDVHVKRTRRDSDRSSMSYLARFVERPICPSSTRPDNGTGPRSLE